MTLSETRVPSAPAAPCRRRYFWYYTREPSFWPAPFMSRSSRRENVPPRCSILPRQLQYPPRFFNVHHSHIVTMSCYNVEYNSSQATPNPDQGDRPPSPHGSGVTHQPDEPERSTNRRALRNFIKSLGSYASQGHRVLALQGFRFFEER